MDKQNRLTRIEEWRVNDFYQWLKGRTLGRTYQCVEVDYPSSSVILLSTLDGHRVTFSSRQWPKRFTKIPPQ